MPHLGAMVLLVVPANWHAACIAAEQCHGPLLKGLLDMRLDTGQFMRMEQRMKLAPRMIQSMEILQLPLMALEERIEKELEANPVLERRSSEFDAPDMGTVAGMPKDAAPAADLNGQAATATPAEDAKSDISDREIEQYLKDSADFSSMNRV